MLNVMCRGLELLPLIRFILSMVLLFRLCNLNGVCGFSSSIGNKFVIVGGKSSTKILDRSYYLHYLRGKRSLGNIIRCFSTRMLVCGDGDLSFSAKISSEIDHNETTLLATVLESERVHSDVYKSSVTNANAIKEAGHKVQFEVDATDLRRIFGDERKFDVIQFNFPHWRGKANNRYNRELLQKFLQSSAAVLSNKGEVRVALFKHQSGVTASTKTEWKGSWLAPQLAAEAGLILHNVSPFQVDYKRSSYRGVDKGFSAGLETELLVFVNPEHRYVEVPLHLQLCCRHELHINLPNYREGMDVNDFVNDNEILRATQSILPSGICCELYLSEILSPEKTGLDEYIAIYMVIYRGISKPVIQDTADIYRAQLESYLMTKLPLRQNKLGRTISKPLPYSTLRKLMSEFVR